MKNSSRNPRKKRSRKLVVENMDSEELIQLLATYRSMMNINYICRFIGITKGEYNEMCKSGGTRNKRKLKMLVNFLMVSPKDRKPRTRKEYRKAILFLDKMIYTNMLFNFYGWDYGRFKRYRYGEDTYTETQLFLIYKAMRMRPLDLVDYNLQKKEMPSI